MPTMTRESWTDERMDDLAKAVGTGFDRVDRQFEQVHSDIRAIQTTMSTREELKTEVAELRGEMAAGFAMMTERFDRAEERADARFEAVVHTILRIGFGLIGSVVIGIFGLIVTHL